MIVTKGTEYQTRDGRAVEISSYQGAGVFAITGAISGRDSYDHWTASGRYKDHDDVESPLDLIEVHAALPTIFRDMCDADKGALLLAARDGKKLQYFSGLKNRWVIRVTGPDHLFDSNIYRIAPTRINGTVEVDADGKPDFETWVVT